MYANVFKALSDENILKLFENILMGENCACKLINKVDVSQPTMSYHLRYLTESGLVDSIKEGIWKKHTVNLDKLDELITYLMSLKNLKGSCPND